MVLLLISIFFPKLITCHEFIESQGCAGDYNLGRGRRLFFHSTYLKDSNKKSISSSINLVVVCTSTSHPRPQTQKNTNKQIEGCSIWCRSRQIFQKYCFLKNIMIMTQETQQIPRCKLHKYGCLCTLVKLYTIISCSLLKPTFYLINPPYCGSASGDFMSHCLLIL